VIAIAERVDVLVIGGSQAGLTAGYYLSRAEIPFLILDAGPRVGEAWRTRWDSLERFTVGRYSALPGLRFPGYQERFAGKDDVADYLESYAKAFDLPVRLNAEVNQLSASDGRYRATASDSTTYEAERVIVATGAYQRPYVPELAAALDDSVTQLHSAD